MYYRHILNSNKSYLDTSHKNSIMFSYLCCGVSKADLLSVHCWVTRSFPEGCTLTLTCKGSMFSRVIKIWQTRSSPSLDLIGEANSSMLLN